MPELTPTRVVIVDDEQLIRAGLRLLLHGRDGIEVVGEAADGREAVSVVAGTPADLVLMDIRMPRRDGISATSDIKKQPDAPPVLVLTTFDDDDLVIDALEAGAIGFLLKEAPPEQLVAGVRTVAAGEQLLAPTVTRRLIERFTSQAPPAAAATVDELTPRELEVLQLIARAMTNAEIAAQLFVSETTVKTHVARILMKLGLRDRVQAVVYAYERGLVHASTA